MARLLYERGAITEFPWLEFTTLRYNYTDHHFLYHLILIPFVILLPPLWGLKIATVLFSSLAIVTFFWFLRQLKVKGAFWFALFLITINPFVYRLNLAKAQALVLIFLFICLYLLINRKYLGLLFASWAYVWLYGGWPILLLLAFLYLVINWVRLDNYHFWFVIKKAKAKTRKQTILLLIVTLLGVLAGIFFSPFFPKNLYFYWQQVFQIAVINYHSVIRVGAEWYPFGFWELLKITIPFFVVFYYSLTLFFSEAKKFSVTTWFFFTISLIFLFLTLKSRRNVEYFIPFGLIFSAATISEMLEQSKNWHKLKTKKIIILTPLLFSLLFWPVFFRDLYAVKQAYQGGIPFNRYQAAMDWLKNNSLPAAVVFHSDWDEFPILFYHNDQNYYLVGLDSTFMYDFSPQLHKTWVDITLGKKTDDLYKIISQVFGADYVFIDSVNNTAFDHNVASNFYFEKVFADKESKIYKVVK
ncbi:MAG: hypothetical protein HY979_03420 [Candidatus Magasanikbacteria bacterium]|nr:hypothetical protein [Candidatus Magasanikbacteria bacterium]